MPAEQRGHAYRTKTAGWGVRWREHGQLTRLSGFPTKTAALAHYRDVIRPRLERQLEPGLRPDVLTFDALCDLYLEAHAPGREANTIRTLTDRLKRPRDRFGDEVLAD